MPLQLGQRVTDGRRTGVVVLASVGTRRGLGGGKVVDVFVLLDGDCGPAIPVNPDEWTPEGPPATPFRTRTTT